MENESENHWTHILSLAKYKGMIVFMFLQFKEAYTLIYTDWEGLHKHFNMGDLVSPPTKWKSHCFMPVARLGEDVTVLSVLRFPSLVSSWSKGIALSKMKLYFF